MTSINPARFVRGWLASSLLVWFLFIPLIAASLIPAGLILRILEAFGGAESWLVDVGRILILFMFPGAIVGFCVAEMQQNITEAHLNWYLPGWSRMSVIGGMAGGLLLYGLIYLLLNRTPGNGLFMLMPAFVLGLSIAQAVVLAQHVRHAWLWIVANVVGGMIFSNIFLSQSLSLGDNVLFLMLPIAWLLAALSQGAITAYVLLWLYESPLPDEYDELAPVPVPVRYDN